MPHLGPIKRKDLIYYLKLLDFEGPYPGGNHQYVGPCGTLSGGQVCPRSSSLNSLTIS